MTPSCSVADTLAIAVGTTCSVVAIAIVLVGLWHNWYAPLTHAGRQLRAESAARRVPPARRT